MWPCFPSWWPGPSCAIPPWPRRSPAGRRPCPNSPMGQSASSSGWAKKCCWPTPWARSPTPCSPNPPPPWPPVRRGWGRRPIPFRSTLTSPPIPTWPSAWGGCLAFIFWKTSTTPISPSRSPSSGGGGTSPCPPGSGITSTSRWGEAAVPPPGTSSTWPPCGCSPGCGMARRGPLCCGAHGSFCCWRGKSCCGAGGWPVCPGFSATAIPCWR